MLRPHDKNVKEWEMYVDIGLYGPAGPAKRGKPFDTVQSLRNLEAYLRKNGKHKKKNIKTKKQNRKQT